MNDSQHQWKSLPFGSLATIRRGPFGGAIKKETFVENGYKVYEQGNAIYDDFEPGNDFY
jgi:type I restriction enzyme, S subunit